MLPKCMYVCILQIVFLGVGYRCYYSFHPGDYKGFAVFEMAAVVAVEGEAWKEFGYNLTAVFRVAVVLIVVVMLVGASSGR